MAATASVTRVTVRSQPKIEAEATIKRTVAVVSTVSIDTFTSIFQLSVRYQTIPRKIAQTQAAMAPSVAVKIPLVMPPISSTGVMIGSTALKRKKWSAASSAAMAPKKVRAGSVPASVAAMVLSYTHNPAVFLLLANLLMLFVGCFLEPTAAITILVPILLPICHQLGIDPVHFGLVMVLNLMIGLLHPPMGMVLFVLARVAKLSVERTTIAILPWLIPLLLSLALITYVPSISLWLPRQFF